MTGEDVQTAGRAWQPTAADAGPSDLARGLPDGSLRRLVEVVGSREDAIVSLLDRHLRLLWASPWGVASLFGRRAAQYQGEDSAQFVHPADRLIYLEGYRRAEAGDTACWRVRARDVEGRYRWVRTVAWSVARSDTDVRFVAITVPVPGPPGVDEHLRSSRGSSVVTRSR